MPVWHIENMETRELRDYKAAFDQQIATALKEIKSCVWQVLKCGLIFDSPWALGRSRPPVIDQASTSQNRFGSTYI